MLFLLHVISPLILGGLVYVYLRSSKIILNKLIATSDSLSIVFSNSLTHSQFPSWFVFNFPDALFIYSLTSVCILLKLKASSHFSIRIIFIISFLSFSIEFLQLINLMPGTFDVLDIIFMISASFLSYYFLIKKRPYLNLNI